MRYKLPCLGVLLLLAMAPTVVEGQGSIAGRVIADDGRPLAGAQVSVVGTDLGLLTSRAGRYRIDNVPAGTQTVRVQSVGFAAAEAEVRVEAGQQSRQDFTIGAVAISVRDLTVTVGSRAMHTAADELAVPVDIYPAAQIVESAQIEMAAVLNELSPSIYFPRRQISDITSGVRPFQLRGLAPDHALVLMNGKRRHSTAVVNVFGGGAFPGGSGVDMNAFPIQAIGRMEILRDGAAAQYGSDAIAGVINMQLKNTVSAPQFLAAIGNYFPDEWENDGLRYDFSGNWGIGIGSRGVLNLTGAFSQRDSTNRAGADARDQVIPGDADFVDRGVVIRKNNAVTQPNHLWGDGEATSYMLFANFELPLSDAENATEFYAFGGYSQRQDLHSGFYRRSLENRNWPQIYPLGFLPKFDSDTRDLSAVAGIRGGGDGGWGWDLSTQYGSNRVNNDIFDTHNASLGPCLDTPCAPGRDGVLGTADDPGIPNAMRFYVGSLENNQFLLNADVWRRVDLGLAGGEATLALGASSRNDIYKVIQGERGSYINGFHPNQSGGIASSGSQVFAGYRPGQAGSWNRSNIGVYGELEAPLWSGVLASVATRYENYSDFGGTLNGKVAFRFEPSEDFIFRTGFSTGFRAPALSQSHYGHVSTNPIGFEVGEFPVDAPEARAVGAVPLTEEKARSFSAGIAVTPTDNLHLTMDGYLTDVDDAIVMSNSLSSDFIKNLLSNFAAESIRFFSNAIDIRSYGLDATLNWRKMIGEASLFEFIASANWSQVRGRCQGDDITACVKENPVLAGEAFDIYDEFDVFFLEEGRPDWRGVFKTRLSTGAFRFGLGANYYGAQQELIALGVGGEDDDSRLLEPKVTFDAEVTYRINERWRLTVGGENIFDAFPTRFDTFGGIFTYRTSSGMGFNGRYLYSRLQASIF
ncbi:TonB-dependent receptor [Candidatus Palauibacter sp.]|uniref:TonB-dependent receptor n=1 Tax=Candidatus Palauibacter sp. TaxID=3101350 RepID=UPI003B5B2E9C